MSEHKILNHYDVKQYTEISTDDFHNYGILQCYGDELLQPHECSILILKPDCISLKHKMWDEFLKQTTGRCVAYVCRLGCMERSVVLGFENKSDAILFKLSFR